MCVECASWRPRSSGSVKCLYPGMCSRKLPCTCPLQLHAQCLLSGAINIHLPDFWIISRILALVSVYKGFNLDPNLEKTGSTYWW